MKRKNGKWNLRSILTAHRAGLEMMEQSVQKPDMELGMEPGDMIMQMLGPQELHWAQKTFPFPFLRNQIHTTWLAFTTVIQAN